MTKTAISIMFLLLLPLVTGAEPEDSQRVLSEIETKRLIIEEAAKTRADIKEHLERKTIDYNKDTQQTIDKNFQVLDSRLDKMIRDAGFKVGVIWFSSIVLAGSLLMWINRRVNKKSILQSTLGDKRFGEHVSITPVEKGDTPTPKKGTPGRKKSTSPPVVSPSVPDSPPPITNAPPIGQIPIIRDFEKDKMPSIGDAL